MNYAYRRAGGPLMTWGTTVPRQAKAAPGALGSLGNPTLILPAPGAPEPIGVTRGAMGGCGCSGSCGCGGGHSHSAVGDFVDSIPGGYIGLAIGVFIAWKFFAKK
jgi:hypothetical protein